MAAALMRFAKWQLRSRVSGDVQVDWVNGAKILAASGETGVTGNIYCGLHEFSDMAFLLHALRPEDIFVDIGANVGSYTVLASASIGATTVCFEPVGSTYLRLLANINLNKMHDRVTTHNVALGSEAGTIEFTSDLNCMNHVVANGESIADGIKVAVLTLDQCVADAPFLVKIDVEGYELPTLQGARSTLANENVCAVILELNESGQRYGFEDEEIYSIMLEHGFEAFQYEPFSRSLNSLEGKNYNHGNTLFLRNLERVKARLSTAPLVEVNKVLL